ncbi:unnamed protein product [Rotaria magnacalcarata]|uniref:Uncharacterized protein n=1 Tax=Rotaria magnacalcarata TaxID=392030 RepID=A0A820GFC0_9BILA|nr:unnamed protein product [Rotaria magnacalcarata]CAF4284010.1 unnamed protein product [Rotaria magnacalcarata]
MVQTGLELSAAKAHKSTRTAARKSKQIVKLLNLLTSNQISLVETISSFAYIVGGPVGRGCYLQPSLSVPRVTSFFSYTFSLELLQHDHIIFECVLSECPPNFHHYTSWTFASAPPGLSPIIDESHIGDVRRSQNYEHQSYSLTIECHLVEVLLLFQHFLLLTWTY